MLSGAGGQSVLDQQRGGRGGALFRLWAGACTGWAPGARALDPGNWTRDGGGCGYRLFIARDYPTPRMAARYRSVVEDQFRSIANWSKISWSTYRPRGAAMHSSTAGSRVWTWDTKFRSAPIFAVCILSNTKFSTKFRNTAVLLNLVI
eukprot:SAG31_NODE_1638_length_7672_cov_4.225142_2_plen_148_part_00